MNQCQSCGMPIAKDDHFGTNKDNSKNKEYCCFCFVNGKFKDEGITVDEKIKKNIAIAIKMGMSEDKAKQLANDTIPALKRWKMN